METSIYDTKTTLNNSGFLAAMEKAREAAGKSIGMISAIGESIGGLGAKFADLSGGEVFARGIKVAMEQGRRFAAQTRQDLSSVSTMVELRQAFQGAGVLGTKHGTSKPVRETVPLDHFNTPDASRLAKVGLFIGGAPQAPGLSEAKRTAVATEKCLKTLGSLLDATIKSLTNPSGFTYAE